MASCIAAAAPSLAYSVTATRLQQHFSCWTVQQAGRSSCGVYRISASTARRSLNLWAPRQRKPREEAVFCRATSYTVTLRTPQGETVLKVPDDVYILDAAEDSGIDLPYSCRSGACSSCAAVLKEGKINQANQSYLEDSQVEEGYVLTCVAYPLSDIVMETHQERGLY